MNTMIDHGAIAPEVQEFLDAVRARLADLDPDEQREILDGLEADLTDLVAERGGEALGDPDAYARELRAAAGLEPEPRPVRRRLAVGDRVHHLFDTVNQEGGRLLATMPGDPAGLLAAVRPAWWVLRGWLAVQVAALWLGDSALSFVPGSDPVGIAALVVGVLLSVQLGRGRIWPVGGWRRLVALRVLLLGLNVLALAMVPAVLRGLEHSRDSIYDSAFRRGVDTGYANGLQESRDSGTDKAGLYLDGTWVSQIYPYDAHGRPLVGVQLFNQAGKPINVITQPEYAATEFDDQGNEIDANGNPIDSDVPQQPRVFYPWTNGAAQLLNVFPIPSRLQDGEEPSPTAFAEKVKPTIGPFPLASVPEVSLPGIRPGVQKPEMQE